jgi:hypothetical protein
MLGQSGTSVRGACNVLIEMMVVVAFVPPPEEGRPAVAVLKVAGMTGILLVLGASLYGIGNLRARRKSATVRSNAIE